MFIYFNGDSNMAGTELPRAKEQSMAAQLAQRFAADFLNQALAGASNDYVYDSTMRYLETHKPDLVVVGWTQPERMQWFIKSKFFEINNLGIGIPVPEEYKTRYEIYKEYLLHSGQFILAMSVYWHNKIFNMHKMLEDKQIPHVFFNAFSHFQFPSISRTPDLHYLDWNETFVSPYHPATVYVNWCEQQGYKQITPGWHHYPPEAHDSWAQLLYDHIKTHNIL